MEVVPGQGGFYTDAVLWGIAQEEGKNADVLSPEEAVAVMTGHSDYQVNAWAAEPDDHPTDGAFCWDDRADCGWRKIAIMNHARADFRGR